MLSHARQPTGGGEHTESLTRRASHGLPLRFAPASQEPGRHGHRQAASRCNMACRYCYWFRDAAVLDAPPRLTPEAAVRFVACLREHLSDHPDVDTMTLVFHGGEPLLYGKRPFARLCEAIRDVEGDVEARITMDVTTNGLLVDDAWAALFRYYGVRPTVSVDGPPSVHDLNRLDLVGRPTHELWSPGSHPPGPSASSPASSPCAIRPLARRHAAPHGGQHGASEFDILIPMPRTRIGPCQDLSVRGTATSSMPGGHMMLIGRAHSLLRRGHAFVGWILERRRVHG